MATRLRRRSPRAGRDGIRRIPAGRRGGALPGLLLALLLLAPGPPPAVAAACGDAAGRLRVLTFNLQFTRAFRPERQVEPLAAHLVSRPADLVLLQEVAGGLVTGAGSVAHLLAERISALGGPRYEVVHAPASGVEGFFTVGNAVLSRCPVLARRTIPLPEIAELRFAGGRWRLARNLVRVDVRFAGGVLHVLDTHLCADCTVEERRRQLAAVLSAARTAGSDGAPVVLGGDFNNDRVRDGGAERPLHEAILAAGFADSAGTGTHGWCERPAHPDAFCTVGVADPWRPESRRIDYIFVRGLAVLAHEVLFNPRIDPDTIALSNHAAVQAVLTLPPGPPRREGESAGRSGGRISLRSGGAGRRGRHRRRGPRPQGRARTSRGCG